MYWLCSTVLYCLRCYRCRWGVQDSGWLECQPNRSLREKRTVCRSIELFQTLTHDRLRGTEEYDTPCGMNACWSVLCTRFAVPSHANTEKNKGLSCIYIVILKEGFKEMKVFDFSIFQTAKMIQVCSRDFIIEWRSSCLYRKLICEHTCQFGVSHHRSYGLSQPLPSDIPFMLLL